MSKEWLIEEKLRDAIVYAAEKHDTQARKGTSIPYLVHPMNVCKILLRYGAGLDLAMAGVLHDVVEDTEATTEEIAERFGARVAELVSGASEPDKGADWRTRKEHTVHSVSLCDDLDLLALKCADKLDNLRDIQFDYEQEGESFWGRFNTPKGKSDQEWYYGTLSEAFSNKLRHSQWEPMARALREEFRLVFSS